MNKVAPFCLFPALAWSTLCAADAEPAAPVMAQALRDVTQTHASPGCKSSSHDEVVVCGRSQQRYRIDPDVLAATRAAEAAPPKPPLDASRSSACTGANCGGGTIPLVGMALAALKAVELAAQGDDWRDAFRTHPTDYERYQETRSRKAAVSIGVRGGNL